MEFGSLKRFYIMHISPSSSLSTKKLDEERETNENELSGKTKGASGDHKGGV